MTEVSARNHRVELVCHRHEDDGTHEGRVRVDGTLIPDTDYIVMRGSCDHIRELWRRARDTYNVNPEISEACSECFPASFLEAESLQF